MKKREKEKKKWSCVRVIEKFVLYRMEIEKRENIIKQNYKRNKIL